MTKPRPKDGYPFEASFVADNDYALGRIVEFLSQTPWWREMAIFVTEDDAQGGRDHIDAHRTVLMGLGPYFKRNYVSHVNTSFPGMLKTIFRLLGLPPLNLFDAVASDLGDCFANTPDYGGYQVLKEDSRLFDPAVAREPLDPRPSPKMDDPEVLREQHEGAVRRGEDAGTQRLSGRVGERAKLVDSVRCGEGSALWLVDLHVVEDIPLKETAGIGATETVETPGDTG